MTTEPMREVEAQYAAHLNPEDAVDHPDGTVFGLPIVADPDVPPGFVRFRVQVPDDAHCTPAAPADTTR